MHNFGGGRSDLFNSGGRWSKGGGIFSKFRGEFAKRGVKKLRGVWTLDKAMAPTPRVVSNFKFLAYIWCLNECTFCTLFEITG